MLTYIFKLTLIITVILTALCSVDYGQSCSSSPEKIRVKEAFRLLSPFQMAQAWKIHLEFVLRTNDLSAQQRQVIAEAKVMLAEDLYRDGADRSVIVALLPRIKTNFTKEQISKIFETLSLEESGSISFVPISYRSQFSLFGPTCNCSHDASLLCEDCTFPECAAQCSYAELGCGPFWAFQCNSICWNNGRPSLPLVFCEG